MKKNFTYDDELYHYGVKGMRWRHRKPGLKPLGRDTLEKNWDSSGPRGGKNSSTNSRDGRHKLLGPDDGGHGVTGIVMKRRGLNTRAVPDHHRVQGFGNAAYQRELRGTRERDRKTSGSASGTDRHYRSTYKAKRNRK